MLGYATYADLFGGTLTGVADRVDYLAELGVTYLHLMPLLKPRPGQNDGGYAVMDYRAVREDLGTIDDLRDLATTLRSRGISLTLDLVLNHVAAEHEWAVNARAGDRFYRDYFYLFADRELPDAYERVAARGLPGLRARATSPTTRSRPPGSGPRSTAGSGTSTGATRRCSTSSPT